MSKFSGVITVLVGRRSIARYGVIGAFSASLDFALFTALINFVNVQLSSILSVATGIATSYVLNSKFNFFQNLAGKRAVRFFAVGISGMTVSTLLITWLVSISVEPVSAKLITIPLVALSQYLLNSLWTFRERQS